MKTDSKEIVRDVLGRMADEAPDPLDYSQLVTVQATSLPSRRRFSGALVALGAFAVVLGIGAATLLIMFAFFQQGGDPVAGLGDSDVSTGYSIKVGPVEVFIVDPEPIATQPDRFLGLVGPVPTFDTADLGPDLSFQSSDPDFSQLEGEDILSAVYLGNDIDGRPYWIYGPGSRNFLKMMGQIIADFACFCRLATSYDTLFAGQASDEVIGLPGGHLTGSSDAPAVLVAEWYGLPYDVAVVAFEVDGEQIGWQRIVGGTAAIRLELPEFEFDRPEDPSQFVAPQSPTVVMIAYDAQGRERDRADLFGGPSRS